jgi:hypothetical protein
VAEAPPADRAIDIGPASDVPPPGGDDPAVSPAVAVDPGPAPADAPPYAGPQGSAVAIHVSYRGAGADEDICAPAYEFINHSDTTVLFSSNGEGPSDIRVEPGDVYGPGKDEDRGFAGPGYRSGDCRAGLVRIFLERP